MQQDCKTLNLLWKSSWSKWLTTQPMQWRTVALPTPQRYSTPARLWTPAMYQRWTEQQAKSPCRPAPRRGIAWPSRSAAHVQSGRVAQAIATQWPGRKAQCARLSGPACNSHARRPVPAPSRWWRRATLRLATRRVVHWLPAPVNWLPWRQVPATTVNLAPCRTNAKAVPASAHLRRATHRGHVASRAAIRQRAATWSPTCPRAQPAATPTPAHWWTPATALARASQARALSALGLLVRRPPAIQKPAAARPLPSTPPLATTVSCARAATPAHPALAKAAHGRANVSLPRTASPPTPVRPVFATPVPVANCPWIRRCATTARPAPPAMPVSLAHAFRPAQQPATTATRAAPTPVWRRPVRAPVPR